MKKFTCSFALILLCLAFSAPAGALEAMYGLTGLYVNKDDAYDGYTLIVPREHNEAYLIDMKGQLVQTWKLPGRAFYGELLPSGNLLVSIETANIPVNFGGAHGRLVELDWNSKIVWQVERSSPEAVLHHGFDRMPNGNTLALVWEHKSWKEAKAKGRKDIPSGPITTRGLQIEGIWPDALLEFDKNGKVVWEWHVWDHIGRGKDQFDINFALPNGVGGAVYQYPDWTHFNSVRYNPKTDQIMMNSRQFSETFIIDKKTGKIVWRWGNPGTHNAGKLPYAYGENGDQQLFGSHDANWLDNGNISIFDNGTYRPSGANSRVVEVDPKTNKIVWQFSLDRVAPNSFYSAYQSSAQKLPNGNYLVTTTPYGHIFEVTPLKEIVWEYISPIGGMGGKGDRICVSGPNPRVNSLHRAFRYGKDSPGFAGKKLTPQGVLNPGCPELAPLLAPYIN